MLCGGRDRLVDHLPVRWAEQLVAEVLEQPGGGRAAAREHIVQSALSQQLQRLERELGVPLLDRTTHHVELTPAGSALLIQARQVLAGVDRATAAAQRAASSTPSLRVGVVDTS